MTKIDVLEGEEIIKGRRSNKLVLFPGSVEEYERFIGRQVEIVDTERPEKYVINTDKGLVARLRDQGVEALVNVAAINLNYGEVYGLPVRRTIRRYQPK